MRPLELRASEVLGIAQDDMGAPFIRDDGGFHPVDLEDVLLGYHLLRRPHSEDAPVVKHHDAVGVLRGDVQIMADHDHEQSVLPGQAPEEPGDPELMSYVEVRCGLVEHQDAGLLDQSAGQHHLLALPRRQLVHVPHCEIIDAQLHKNRIHHSQVVVRGPP